MAENTLNPVLSSVASGSEERGQHQQDSAPEGSVFGPVIARNGGLPVQELCNKGGISNTWIMSFVIRECSASSCGAVHLLDALAIKTKPAQVYVREFLTAHPWTTNCQGASKARDGWLNFGFRGASGRGWATGAVCLLYKGPDGRMYILYHGGAAIMEWLEGGGMVMTARQRNRIMHALNGNSEDAEFSGGYYEPLRELDETESAVLNQCVDLVAQFKRIGDLRTAASLQPVLRELDRSGPPCLLLSRGPKLALASMERRGKAASAASGASAKNGQPAKQVRSASGNKARMERGRMRMNWLLDHKVEVAEVWVMANRPPPSCLPDTASAYINAYASGMTRGEFYGTNEGNDGLWRVLHEVASQLNGSNGEATNSDDVKYPGASANNYGYDPSLGSTYQLAVANWVAAHGADARFYLVGWTNGFNRSQVPMPQQAAVLDRPVRRTYAVSIQNFVAGSRYFAAVEFPDARGMAFGYNYTRVFIDGVWKVDYDSPVSVRFDSPEETAANWQQVGVIHPLVGGIIDIKQPTIRIFEVGSVGTGFRNRRHHAIRDPIFIDWFEGVNRTLFVGPDGQEEEVPTERWREVCRIYATPQGREQVTMNACQLLRVGDNTQTTASGMALVVTAAAAMSVSPSGLIAAAGHSSYDVRLRRARAGVVGYSLTDRVLGLEPSRVIVHHGSPADAPWQVVWAIRGVGVAAGVFLLVYGTVSLRRTLEPLLARIVEHGSDVAGRGREAVGAVLDQARVAADGAGFVIRSASRRVVEAGAEVGRVAGETGRVVSATSSEIGSRIVEVSAVAGETVVKAGRMVLEPPPPPTVAERMWSFLGYERRIGWLDRLRLGVRALPSAGDLGSAVVSRTEDALGAVADVLPFRPPEPQGLERVKVALCNVVERVQVVAGIKKPEGVIGRVVQSLPSAPAAATEVWNQAVELVRPTPVRSVWEGEWLYFCASAEPMWHAIVDYFSRAATGFAPACAGVRAIAEAAAEGDLDSLQFLGYVFSVCVVSPVVEEAMKARTRVRGVDEGFNHGFIVGMETFSCYANGWNLPAAYLYKLWGHSAITGDRYWPSVFRHMAYNCVAMSVAISSGWDASQCATASIPVGAIAAWGLESAKEWFWASWPMGANSNRALRETISPTAVDPLAEVKVPSRWKPWRVGQRLYLLGPPILEMASYAASVGNRVHSAVTRVCKMTPEITDLPMLKSIGESALLLAAYASESGPVEEANFEEFVAKFPPAKRESYVQARALWFCYGPNCVDGRVYRGMGNDWCKCFLKHEHNVHRPDVGTLAASDPRTICPRYLPLQAAMLPWVIPINQRIKETLVTHSRALFGVECRFGSGLNVSELSRELDELLRFGDCDAIIVNGDDCVFRWKGVSYYVDGARWDAHYRAEVHEIKLSIYRKLGMPGHLIDLSHRLLSRKFTWGDGVSVRIRKTNSSGESDTTLANGIGNLLTVLNAMRRGFSGFQDFAKLTTGVGFEYELAAHSATADDVEGDFCSRVPIRAADGSVQLLLKPGKVLGKMAWSATVAIPLPELRKIRIACAIDDLQCFPEIVSSLSRLQAHYGVAGVRHDHYVENGRGFETTLDERKRFFAERYGIEYRRFVKALDRYVDGWINGRRVVGWELEFVCDKDLGVALKGPKSRCILGAVCENGALWFRKLWGTFRSSLSGSHGEWTMSDDVSSLSSGRMKILFRRLILHDWKIGLCAVVVAVCVVVAAGISGSPEVVGLCSRDGAWATTRWAGRARILNYQNSRAFTWLSTKQATMPNRKKQTQPAPPKFPKGRGPSPKQKRPRPQARNFTGDGLYRLIGPMAKMAVKAALPVALNNAASLIRPNAARIQGSGDYVTNDIVHSASSATKVANGAPRTVFTHSEYVTDVLVPSTPAAFNIQRFTLNPADTATFPWLSRLASLYTKYQFKKLLFEFRTNTSNYSAAGTLGSVILAPQYNVDAQTFTSKQLMEAASHAVSAAPSTSIMMGFECAKKDNVNQWYQVLNESTQLRNNFTDVGAVSVATSGLPGTAGTSLGELWVHYTCELIEPYISVTDQFNTGASSQVAGYFAGSGNNANGLTLGFMGMQYSALSVITPSALGPTGVAATLSTSVPTTSTWFCACGGDAWKYLALRLPGTYVLESKVRLSAGPSTSTGAPWDLTATAGSIISITGNNSSTSNITWSSTNPWLAYRYVVTVTAGTVLTSTLNAGWTGTSTIVPNSTELVITKVA